jgi:ankyrin repeat protein
LIDKGADVNAKTEGGWTALMVVAAGGYADTMKGYTSAMDSPFTGRFSETGHYVGTLRALIAGGADVNAKTEDGWTALMVAVGKGRTAIVEALIAGGADVNAKTEDGWTALMVAADWGRAQKDILRISPHPVMELSFLSGGKYYYIETVQTLIAAGADVNAKNNLGETALKKATENRHTEIARLLKKAGAKS